jgi:hypothetical protein
MELTRQEQRLLSRRNNVALLWLGVAMVVFASGVPILALVKWKEADAIWQRRISAIESMTADGTNTERTLKGLLTANVRSSRDLDGKRVDQMAQKGFIMLAFPGLMCIGLYFRTRVYHRLFERLLALPQPSAPSDPT